MPQKRKLVDRVGQQVWNFPLKSFLVFFLATNVTMFVFHRLIMFHDFYHQERAMLKDDSYVNQHICQNDTLKANLGENYVQICHRAEVDSQKWVLINAFRRTIQNTFLCGDAACLELFETIMEIVTRSLAWTICAVLIGVIVTVCVGIYCFGTCCGGSRRWKKSNVRYIDLEEQIDERHEFSAPLEIVYDNFDEMKKKI